MKSGICPSCGAVLQADGSGGFRCSGCGAVFSGPQVRCPECGWENEAGSLACARCAAELTAACPGCGRINGIGAERCGGCGRELDALAHAFRTVNASLEARRQDMLRRAPSLRETGERESQARLDILRKADRRRMQRELERAAKAKLRERRIVRGAGVVLVVLIIIVMLAAVFSLSYSTGSP